MKTALILLLGISIGFALDDAAFRLTGTTFPKMKIVKPLVTGNNIKPCFLLNEAPPEQQCHAVSSSIHEVSSLICLLDNGDVAKICTDDAPNVLVHSDGTPGPAMLKGVNK